MSRFIAKSANKIIKENKVGDAKLENENSYFKGYIQLIRCCVHFACFFEEGVKL